MTSQHVTGLILRDQYAPAALINPHDLDSWI
jgi:hypothetical protein